jgi:NADH:ubiquinone oxidoreductase subunit 4 (subunit M)
VAIFIGGLFGGLVAIFQSDAKSLVAYSSVSHMGLLTGGIMRGRYIGLISGFIVVLCHGLVSSLLFYCVGLVYGLSGGRTFSRLFGLLFLFPFFGYIVFVALAANFSVPPFISLLGELGLLAFYGSLNLTLFLVFAALSYSCAVFCFYLFSSAFIGGVYSSGFSGSSFCRVSGYFCGLVIHISPFCLYLLSLNSAFSCF